MRKIDQEDQEIIDQQRIVSICKRMGYEVSVSEAYSIWSEYSDSPAICTGWLSLPISDEEIWEAIEGIILRKIDEQDD